jgi:chromosomal replication initiator protein
VTLALWKKCLDCLQDELPSQQYNTWIRPLQAEFTAEELHLYAPNRFVINWVEQKFLARIKQLLQQLNSGHAPKIIFAVGTKKSATASVKSNLSKARARSADDEKQAHRLVANKTSSQTAKETTGKTPQRFKEYHSFLNKAFTFRTFVEGGCNQLAYGAALKVVDNLGAAYNPLFLYGGVGLGKTHLMQAVGNKVLDKVPDKKVVYLHAERFAADMVKALQSKAINEFKRYYRSLNTLLIDDIQFLSGKERTQEEFFHTFNALLESGQQMILTCDCYPKEIKGLEERLKSRFGWGLTVVIEPPELETRVSILMKKAQQVKIDLPEKVAFFIAQRVRSNVRELEGVLKRVIASSHFTGRPITLDLVAESLKDLLAIHDKLVSMSNIKRVVAEYFKELTDHSLPEIGEAFGGRDHTTVMHACRKIKELRQAESAIDEDYKNLLRIIGC